MIREFTLLIGGAGSGKTYRSRQLFQEYLNSGKEDRVIFILPGRAQVRKVSEKILEETEGLFTSGITTFSALAKHIYNAEHPGTKPISGISKRLIFTKILREIEYFGTVRDYPGFIDSLAAIIKEFKEGFITPSLLEKALKHNTAGEEALITTYRKYQQTLAEKQMCDEEDILSGAFNLLSENLFKNKEMLIVDGFYNFTPVEYKFLEKLAGIFPKINITLPFEKNRREIYETVEPTYRKLLKLSPSRIEWLKPVRWKDKTLLHLEQNIFRASSVRCKADDSLTILEVVSDLMEVEKIAKEIKKLAAEGYSFSDFGIILRDTGEYSNIFRDILWKYSIPFEIGTDSRLSSSPLIKIFLTFLKLVSENWTRDNIIEFMKSRYTNFNRKIADKIELESLMKGIDDNREKWLGDFGKREIDGKKRTFFKKLCEWQEKFSRIDTAAGFYDLSIKVIEELEISPEDAPALGKLYQLLQEIALHQKSISLKGFCETFSYLANYTRYRTRSRKKNKVMILNVYESREEEFRVVFICNLLEKQFPKQTRENPLLPDSERKRINREGHIRLEESGLRTSGERYLFYTALTRAREKIVLSFPRFSGDTELLPSFYLDEIKRIFSEDTINYNTFDFSSLISPYEDTVNSGELLAAIGYYMWNKFEFSKEIIENCLLSTSLLRRNPDLLDELTPASGEAMLSDSRILEKIARDPHALSSTQLETFANCPYRHFCNYTLRIKEILIGGTPLDRGLILHDVLSKFHGELHEDSKKAGFTAPCKEKLRERIFKILDTVFNTYNKRSWQPYQIGAERKTIEQLLDNFIRQDIKFQSKRSLIPRYFELAFGQVSGYKGEKLDPASTEDFLEIKKENENVLIRGRMDRVDTGESGREAVVIDYKSGRNSFSLEDVKKGLSLQLPIYMIAIQEIFHLEPVAGEIFSLKDGRRRGMYSENAKDLIQDLRENSVIRKEEFVKLLEKIHVFILNYVKEIRKGKISVEPNNCRNCPYNCICGYEG